VAKQLKIAKQIEAILHNNEKNSCFRPYWVFIRPWSGLIRRLWLKSIKRRAEKQQV
jgi:hypothetical protein